MELGIYCALLMFTRHRHILMDVELIGFAGHVHSCSLSKRCSMQATIDREGRTTT